MPPDAFAERVRAADLDRYLATLYAPAAVRPALFVLHALDLELLDVVRTTTEPMVGMIRLAWWREALERLDSAPPPAEPLLQAIAARILPCGISGGDLARLESGDAALIEAPIDGDAYLAGRGEALFVLAARLIGGDAIAAARAGRLWAAAELSRLRQGTDIVVDIAGDIRAAPPPLRALASLARHDLASRKFGRRGSPSRQLRMLWSMIAKA